MSTFRFASLFTKLFRRAPKTIRHSNPAARTPLGLTALESREVPATLSGGTIYINGTPAADTVYVSETVPTNWYEVSKIQVVENGRTQFFPKHISTTTVFFTGGTGNDIFQNSAYLKTFGNGGGGADVLSGGPLADVLYGDGENDALYGNGGMDTLYGGNGADEMRGGGDNDTLYGGENTDTMRGGPGNDTLYGQNGNDSMYGDNNIFGTAGGAGADRLYGGAGNDSMYGEGGKDTVSGGPDIDSLFGGTDDDTLIAIDNGLNDSVYADGGRDTLWVDDTYWGTDAFFGEDPGLDVIHRVEWFHNGPDKTMDGDSIADPDATADGNGNPITAMYNNFASRPLFADAGPTAADVDQQDRGDCWLMATAASVANQNPHQIRSLVADAGDGTYLVSLGSKFYRVDADLPVSAPGGAPRNAGLGVQNSLWVAIVEKAYTHFRTAGVQHSYQSLDNGNPADAARAFGLSDVGQAIYGPISDVDGMGNELSTTTYSTALELRDQIQAQFDAGRNVTICTDAIVPASSPLISSHCWAVTGIASDADGNFTTITLRNPWGLDLIVSLEDMYATGVCVTWGTA